MLNIRCKNTANTTSERGSGKTIRKNAENRNPRKPLTDNRLTAMVSWKPFLRHTKEPVPHHETGFITLP